jgi:hypothetical protein
MRTIIYNDEAGLWSRSNHLMEIRLLPSSDDNDSIFSRTHWEPLDWNNGQSEYTCDWDWDCLTMHTFVPCLQFFYLFKPVAHVCTPKMTEDELSAYSFSSHNMSWAM